MPYIGSQNSRKVINPRKSNFSGSQHLREFNFPAPCDIYLIENIKIIFQLSQKYHVRVAISPNGLGTFFSKIISTASLGSKSKYPTFGFHGYHF